MTDFVKISYTARVKDGPIFDTTSEEVAKKEGIYDEKKIYSLLPVAVGEGQLIQGLDEELENLKPGEEKTIEIPPEKGYGKKDPDKISVISKSAFKKQGVNPIPGMVMTLDDKPARIQTVTGGRVRVDFNHELAGKTLVFNVKVEEKANTDEDKIRYLIERSFNSSENFGINVNNGETDIQVPEKAYRDRNILVRKAALVAEIFKYLGKDAILFTEIWKNPKESSEVVGKND